jgi:hypothetical protein
MVLSEDFRKEKWDEFEKLQHSLIALKTFVQNPMDINQSTFNEYENINAELIVNLNQMLKDIKTKLGY